MTNGENDDSKDDKLTCVKTGESEKILIKKRLMNYIRKLTSKDKIIHTKMSDY